MKISQLIALLEQAQRINGDTNILIQVATDDSFNSVLTSDVINVVIEGNAAVIS